MDNVSKVVTTTTDGMTSKVFQMPGFIWGVFWVFHKTHTWWRLWRRADVYSNPDNWAQLAAGNTLNFTLGDTLPVRFAAHAVQIATRIIECVEKKESFYFAWCKLKSAFTGRYPLRDRTSWKEQSSSRVFSTSTVIWFKSGGKAVIVRIKRITLAFGNVFKQGFQLSMHILDTVEAFKMSPSTRNQAVGEVFVNATKVLDTMEENKEALVKRLENNEALIDKVLVGVGSSYSAKKLTEHVVKTIDTTSKVNDTMKKVSSAANGVIKDFLKRGVFGFMSTIGLSEYTPGWLVPDLNPKWTEEPKRNYGRYPPVENLTKKAAYQLPQGVTYHEQHAALIKNTRNMSEELTSDDIMLDETSPTYAGDTKREMVVPLNSGTKQDVDTLTLETSQPESKPQGEKPHNVYPVGRPPQTTHA